MATAIPVLLVALIHAFFLPSAMSCREAPRTRKVFGTTAELAAPTYRAKTAIFVANSARTSSIHFF
jgi:uncharacterized membrane protein